MLRGEEGHQARWRRSRGFEDILVQVLIRMGVMLGRDCAVSKVLVVLVVLAVVVVRGSGVARGKEFKLLIPLIWVLVTNVGHLHLFL